MATIEEQARQTAQRLRDATGRVRRRGLIGTAEDMRTAANLLEALAGAYTTAAGVTEEEWAVHILGPDDVIPQPSELAALREANKLNQGIARMYAADPSPHNPHCWAVVVKMKDIRAAVEKAVGDDPQAVYEQDNGVPDSAPWEDGP